MPIPVFALATAVAIDTVAFTLSYYVTELVEFVYDSIFEEGETVPDTGETGEGTPGTSGGKTESLMRDILKTNKALLTHQGVLKSTYEPLENNPTSLPNPNP
jgi:hypothetical protein